MAPDSAKKYLKTQILTAPPEQLLIMLFDGAIRFCEQAKERIDERNIEESHNLLMRAQRIMLELVSSLKKDGISEELYNNLCGLYLFVYRRLIHANIKKDKTAIDEALRILSSLRETWAQAIEIMHKEEASATKDSSPSAGGVSIAG